MDKIDANFHDEMGYHNFIRKIKVRLMRIFQLPKNSTSSCDQHRSSVLWNDKAREI